MAKLEKKDKNLVELQFTIPAERFEEGLEKAYRRNRQRFTIPGFRKGKAPMGLVIRYYGEGVLYDDAIQAVVPEALAAAIEEHHLEPVAQPAIDIVSIGRGKDLEIKAEVTLKPEVKLGDYRGVEAIKPAVEVTEEQVDRELERVRQRNARLVTVEDRPVQKDDTVLIDYKGEKDGVAFEGGTAEDYRLKIGSNSFIPGFEDQIIGHETGEEFDIQVTFPEDYHEKSLAGQEVVFHIKLKEIQFNELPVLDDEFAKDVSEWDTLAEYRKELREGLEKSREEMAEAQFENNAVEAAIARAEVDIPAVMIENRMDQIANEQAQAYTAQGIPFETLLGYMGQTREEFRERFREQAERQVKGSLVLEAIAKAEKLEAEEADFEEQFQNLAQQYRMELEEVKRYLDNEEGRKGLSEQILLQKAARLVRDSAFPQAEPQEELEVKAPEKAEGKGDEASETKAPKKTRKSKKTEEA